MPINPGTLGSGAVAATLAMVLQLQCTGVSVEASCNFSDEAVGTAGVYAGGNVSFFLRDPVAPAWRACVGACLSAAAFCAPCWVSRCSRSSWTCKSTTEDANALMISRIWLI